MIIIVAIKVAHTQILITQNCQAQMSTPYQIRKKKSEECATVNPSDLIMRIIYVLELY